MVLAYFLVAVVSLVAATAVAVLLGRRRWQRASLVRRETMRAACLPLPGKFYDPSEIGALPAPVKRYFETALQAGQAMVATVRFSQQGQFRLNEKKNIWQPFQASQFVTMQPPGFDWDARIRMAPGVDVWVHDSYLLGAGSLRAAVLGLVTVADVRDTAASARGELLRYLAEAAW